MLFTKCSDNVVFTNRVPCVFDLSLVKQDLVVLLVENLDAHGHPGTPGNPGIQHKTKLSLVNQDLVLLFWFAGKSGFAWTSWNPWKPWTSNKN